MDKENGDGGMNMKFITQVIIGSILASLLIIGTNAWIDSSRAKEPPENWLEVKSLFVEPHSQGDDPILFMDRVIKKRFTARWIAEVHQKQGKNTGYSTICWGSDVSDYSPTKSLPDPLQLSWFMGKTCELEPGTYRLCGTWVIQPPNYPEKIVRACSAPFDVKSG